MTQETGGSRNRTARGWGWSTPPNLDIPHNLSPYVVHKGSGRKAGGGEKEIGGRGRGYAVESQRHGLGENIKNFIHLIYY